ncbi:MAG: hypothetical protein AB2A00_18660 [Myxococcota bacterium]
MHQLRAGVLVCLAFMMGCPNVKPAEGNASGPQHSTVALLGDRTAVVVDGDNEQVVFLDLDSAERVATKVGRNPAQVTKHGNHVAVSNRGDRTVTILHSDTHEVLRTITVGVEPIGLTFLDEFRLAVALSGEKAIVVVDVDSGALLKRVDLELPQPRALAVTRDGRIYVSHFLSHALSVISPSLDEVHLRDITLRTTTSPLHPSLLNSLTLSFGGDEIGIAHVSLNTDITPKQGNSGWPGYLGNGQEYMAATPTITQIDVAKDAVRSDATPRDDPANQAVEGSFTTKEESTSALLTINNTQLRESFTEPITAAYVDGDRGFAALARGTRQLNIWRRNADGTRDGLAHVFNVGHGADGLAASKDGRFLVVRNAGDLTLSIIPVPAVPAFNDLPLNEKLAASLGPQPVTTETLRYADSPLPVQVQDGRKLFMTAQRECTMGGVTCIMCHPDGRADGRVWPFIDGRRNTMNLSAATEEHKGLATTTAPLHWGGELANHYGLQRTINEFMGGTGLNGQQLDAVAAFIDTLPAPDSPTRASPLRTAPLDEVQQRGKDLFDDPAVGCRDCHMGEYFTDNLSHDVGVDDGQLRGVQTPVLIGLDASGPYLHDGSAATVEEVLERLVRTDRMGRGSHLSDKDLVALAAYLKTM